MDAKTRGEISTKSRMFAQPVFPQIAYQLPEEKNVISTVCKYTVEKWDKTLTR